MKIYVNNSCLNLISASPSFTPTESDIIDPKICELDITNVLKKLQFTKQLNIISDNITQIQEVLMSQMRLIRAGGGLVRNESGQILMIFRNNRWDLPKGKLEQGEQIEQCAVREVEEECGIEGVTLGAHLTDTFHIYSLEKETILKKTSWYSMYYTGSEMPTPQTIEGITAVVWVNPDEVATRLQNSYNTIVDVFAVDSLT